jgi:uncharacterized protein (DUF433 family)
MERNFRHIPLPGQINTILPIVTGHEGEAATMRTRPHHSALSVGAMPPIISKLEGGKMANPLDRISIDPAVCGGKPCIKGTRIWVALILDLLAAGVSEAQVRTEYPQLTHDDVLAAIAYGAEASREQVIIVPVESAV